MRRLIAGVFAALLIMTAAPAPWGKAAYGRFAEWRKSRPELRNDWDRAVDGYRMKLRNENASEAEIERAMRAIDAYGEAELYDDVYAAKTPTFNTEPNRLLVEAIKGRKPGKALDIAMGLGRNSIHLASQGWKVTGFDVSAKGIEKAKELARSRSVAIDAVHSSDEDFEFGHERWDLIASIYAMEKRSVQRARDALKPGGLVVVEAGHQSASGAPWEYESGELPRIFAGFRIIRYEEVTAISDWGKGTPIKLVRLVAEKPR